MQEFEAKPNLNNRVNVKVFSTEEAAIEYLNIVTGYSLLSSDWYVLKKLKRIK